MGHAHHQASDVVVNATAEAVFDHLDDQSRLGGHMEKPSAMMMGGRMTYELDAGKGRVVGSRITMRGSLLGLNLFVTEAITERTPPVRKIWETRERPHLLVIDSYRMGFEITPMGERCRLRLFIDYTLPRSWPARLLGAIFAPIYARWCIDRMSKDATTAFGG